MKLFGLLQSFFIPGTLSRLYILTVALFLATSQFPAASASAAQASLTWNAPTTYSDGTPTTNLEGYKIYTGTASGDYSQNIDVGNVTSYTLSSLNDATTYYFTVTAYNATGDVSGFSNQASFTTTAPTPPAVLYTLTASAGSGGSISPSGSVAISQGLSQTFAITPNNGYKITAVTVDGASVGALSSYTFSNISASHTISAIFSANALSYSIMASAGTGGSISPAGTVTVTSGGSQTFTVTPATGYKISAAKVDGASVGALSSYTFSKASANHTISATFAANVTSYAITASAGAGGSISPAGTTAVNSGGNKTFTISPSAGYKIASVTVDGVSVGTNSTYTISNVAASHTIAATFRNKHR